MKTCSDFVKKPHTLVTSGALRVYCALAIGVQVPRLSTTARRLFFAVSHLKRASLWRYSATLRREPMKLTKMLMLITFVALFGWGSLFGQTSTGPAIPDSTAQRLYFLSLSNLDVPNRQAHFTFSNKHQSAVDISASLTAVSDFQTSYNQAVEDYNNAVKGSGFSQGILATFQHAQANITAIAMGYVQSHLSAAGYTALQDDIASAKNHMEIPYGQTTMAMAGTTTTTTNMGCCYSLIATQTVNVISSDPFRATVTFSRTLEGSATISDPSIKHQGSITAYVGTRSQTNQGQWLTPNIYINLNASVTLDTALDSCLLSNLGCSDSSTDFVHCSVAGTVFQTTFPFIGAGFRLSAAEFAGLSGTRCAWLPTCVGTCSTPYTTNTNSSGGCYTTGPYRQCIDFVVANECVLYRVTCFGRKAPGVCD
jgi:hypothetical protein